MEVEVRRSARRRRTVSARVEGDTIVVLMPASATARQEKIWVERMVAQLEQRQARRRPSDERLMTRAAELSRAYIVGRPVPESVRWVTNMRTRWGSCTPADGAIRLSHRLQAMPSWVADYVLVHELAHLVEPGHNDRFHAIVAAYPHVERAKAYLEGFSAGVRSAGEPVPGDLDEGVD